MLNILQTVALEQLLVYLHHCIIAPLNLHADLTIAQHRYIIFITASDFLQSVDKGHLSLLTQDELSSAFDTINYNILLAR